jgi:hypothetical protein
LDRIKAALGLKTRAPEKFFPKDETLRLVLSEEERDFISLTIRKQKYKIASFLTYIFLFIIAYFVFPDAYYNGMSRLARWGSSALFIAGLGTPIAAAMILDGFYRLIKFARYRREHRAFLRKYDRERLYYEP